MPLGDSITNGTGSNDTAAAIELSQEAEAAGADALCGPAAKAKSAAAPSTNAILRSAMNAASRSAITTWCGRQ